MNPKISNAAKLMPFDATEYVWIDLSQLREHPSHIEKYGGIAPKEGALYKALEMARSFTTIQDYPLPFEKIAIIPPTDNWGAKEVLTIERNTVNAHYGVWMIGVSDCIYELVMHDAPVGGIPGVSFTPYVESKYYKQVMARFDGDKNKLGEWMLKACMGLMTYLIMVAQGAYGKEKQDVGVCTSDATVNAKRKRKGKLPMYEWKTINILDRDSREGPGTGRERGAVREHYVRGHYMYLSKLNKTVWRKAHKRGDATLGSVFHDYIASAA